MTGQGQTPSTVPPGNNHGKQWVGDYVGPRQPVWRLWKREISFAPASPQPTHYNDDTIPTPSVTYTHVSCLTEACFFLFYLMTEITAMFQNNELNKCEIWKNSNMYQHYHHILLHTHTHTHIYIYIYIGARIAQSV